MSSPIRKKSQNAAAEQQTEEAMVIAETPARPWSRLSTDLFEEGTIPFVLITIHGGVYLLIYFI